MYKYSHSDRISCGKYKHNIHQLVHHSRLTVTTDHVVLSQSHNDVNTFGAEKWGSPSFDHPDPSIDTWIKYFLLFIFTNMFDLEIYEWKGCEIFFIGATSFRGRPGKARLRKHPRRGERRLSQRSPCSVCSVESCSKNSELKNRTPTSL